MTTKRNDYELRAADRMCDSIPYLPRFRGDSSEGVWAQEMARQTIQRVWEHRYPQRKWINGGLCPINREVSAGALQYNYLELEKIGEAELVATNATDIPHAEVAGQNTTKEIFTPALMVTYSTQDLRTSQETSSFDIVSQKVSALRAGWDLKMNRLIRTGQADNGLEGVTNHSNIVVQNAVTGTWPGATPDQIIADVTTAINSIDQATDGVEQPNTVVLPNAQYNLLATTRVGVGLDGSTGSILDFLKGAFPEIQRWEKDHGMDVVGAAGGPAMLVYTNSIDNLSAVFPLMLSPLPPQDDGLSVKLIFESRYGGIMMPRPRSVLRLDGI